jgi:ABC-type transport system involved in multi-copper enzyme maturation permease subunit
MGEAQNDRELVDGLSSRPFAAADIPKFHDDPIPMADSMSSLLWNIAILSAFSAVFFMAAYICFLYQDIK